MTSTIPMPPARPQRGSGRPWSGAARGRADLFARFRALVELHFSQHGSVPRYAKALAMTQNRLNRLCQALASPSAQQPGRRRLNFRPAPGAALSAAAASPT